VAWVWTGGAAQLYWHPLFTSGRAKLTGESNLDLGWYRRFVFSPHKDRS